MACFSECAGIVDHFHNPSIAAVVFVFSDSVGSVNDFHQPIPCVPGECVRTSGRSRLRHTCHVACSVVRWRRPCGAGCFGDVRDLICIAVSAILIQIIGGVSVAVFCEVGPVAELVLIPVLTEFQDTDRCLSGVEITTIGSFEAIQTVVCVELIEIDSVGGSDGIFFPRSSASSSSHRSVPYS